MLRQGRRRRIALLVLAAVAVLLAVNTVLVERDTDPADPDIGRILELPGGDVQVREDGDPDDPPLILVHGFQASLRWWDRVTPKLARDHHVVRIDLLGHGGSEKPRDGYSMPEQGDLVAQVMERLGIRRAAVVGHSMGGQVVTALAERHRNLVDRLMVIDTAPENRFSRNRRTQAIAAFPVLGHAISRVTPDSAIRKQVDLAFADGTDVPDVIYDDPKRATFNSFTGSRDGSREYRDEKPLDERLAGSGIRLHVIFGSEDELVDPKAAEEWDVPGVRVAVLPGRGHSPMVEEPERMARLIAEFARVRE
ncbi:MAG TPA: alpha/beta hydrolase [Thermoleophilaceae bacterium]